jgi:hypothetical protein
VSVRDPSYAVQHLGLRLLPPEQAYDFEYWAGRLIRPGLLRDAVAVVLHRLPLLAVPAGPGRRGGHLDMINPVFAELTVQALRNRPGFELVTNMGSAVTWGDRPSEHLSSHDLRLFYGLREPAVDRVGPTWPPARHRGYDSEAGRWPPVSEQLPGRHPPPREAAPAGAAHTPR